MKNVDCIRNLTDSELSSFLDDVQKYNIVPLPICAEECNACKEISCKKCWEMWLKQEADE